MTQDIHMTQDIELSRDGAVMSAAFARPQKKNAITGAMYEALIEAFDDGRARRQRRRVHAERQGRRVHRRKRPRRFCRRRIARERRLSGVAVHHSARRVRQAAGRRGRRARDRHWNDASLSLRSRLRDARVALPDAVRQPWPRAGSRVVAARAATLSAAPRRPNSSCSPSRSTPGKRTRSASSTLSSPGPTLSPTR